MLATPPLRPAPGYYPSPWPGEDGGPARLQHAAGLPGLGLRPGERLGVTRRRLSAATMIVLRAPGEVYLLRHSLFRSFVGLPTHARVERLDPHTLQPLARSADLAAGPFWPGGLAAHANGSLYTVYGRHCHRLAPDLTVLAARRLARAQPYNSFVILGDGTLAMKEIQRAQKEPSHLTLLEPERLTLACPELELPEPVVARLSARDDTLYIVGVRSLFRYRWDPRRGRLELDERWRLPYRRHADQSYGWDPVVADDHVWFMDNGDHRYRYHLRGAGVAQGPVRLWRTALADAGDALAETICGEPRGTITNPPLFAPERGVALAYDASAAVLRAYRQGADGRLEPLWRRDGFAHASHFVYFPATGEVVTHDFDRVRGDDAVVLSIDSGSELARAHVGGLYQSVLFPAPGWERDYYYVSFSRIARVFVA